MAVVIAAVVAVATDVADDWSDWVVLGVVCLAVLGTAVAVHHRQYPTRKRALRRDPDSRW